MTRLFYIALFALLPALAQADGIAGRFHGVISNWNATFDIDESGHGQVTLTQHRSQPNKPSQRFVISNPQISTGPNKTLTLRFTRPEVSQIYEVHFNVERTMFAGELHSVSKGYTMPVYGLLEH